MRCVTRSSEQLVKNALLKKMLRKPVKPLMLDMKNKKKDYKILIDQIQNEGQEFDAHSRTD